MVSIGNSLNEEICLYASMAVDYTYVLRMNPAVWIHSCKFRMNAVDQGMFAVGGLKSQTAQHSELNSEVPWRR